MPRKIECSVLRNCCICLGNHSSLINLTSSNASNEANWISKLRSCVAEIDWSEDYWICQICSEQVDKLYNFRQLCFHTEEVRKNSATLKRLNIENNPNEESDANEYCGYDSDDNYNASSETVDGVPESAKSYLINFPGNRKVDELHTTYTEKECVDITGSRNPSQDFRDLVPETKTCFDKNPPVTSPDLPKINFVCSVCDNSFNKRVNLVKHSVTEHGMKKMDVRPYPCTECPKRFNTSSHWKAHYLNCHKHFRRDVCTYCGKIFSSRTALNTHEEVHLNKREYQCSMCPKRFNTSANKKGHELIVHTDPSKWKYVCAICNKRFHSKSNMSTHIRRHNKEKPFSCHLCDKRFCDACDLQLHLPSHTNVREYKCTECEKEYKRERDLKMHMAKDHKVNNGVKPYVKKKKFSCQLCPKAFDAKDKLLRHLCSHTGDKPFPCSICDKRFTDKWYATQHMRTVHDYTTENNS